VLLNSSQLKQQLQSYHTLKKVKASHTSYWALGPGADTGVQAFGPQWWRVEGQVDLDGSLHTEIVPPPGVGHVTHTSTNRAQRRLTSLIEIEALPLRTFFCCIFWSGIIDGVLLSSRQLRLPRGKPAGCCVSFVLGKRSHRGSVSISWLDGSSLP